MSGHAASTVRNDRAAALRGDGAVLVSALCYAFSFVLVRRQALVAGPVEVAFSQSLIVTALMVVGEAALWASGGTGALSWPDMRHTVLIATAAVLAVASLILLAWAYARGEVSMLSTGEYTAFVWAAGLGWILFGERVSMATLAGAWTPKARPAATIMTLSSGLAFVLLAATPTYSATTAAIHSYSDSLRHQLRDTAIEVIEIAPPAVATDLMPGHAENPRSMRLDAYIAETVTNLKAHPKSPEDSVDHVGMLRHAERDGRYGEVFDILNASH